MVAVMSMDVQHVPSKAKVVDEQQQEYSGYGPFRKRPRLVAKPEKQQAIGQNNGDAQCRPDPVSEFDEGSIEIFRRQHR